MANRAPYPDLKPCPCCGGEAAMQQTGRDKLKIQCRSCAIKHEQRCWRYSMEWLEQQMAETWNRRTPPADMALVSREITAESGHKTGMIGDFKTSIEVECSQCDTDDPYSQCDECGGKVFYRHEVAVSWPTIKAIHRRIIELSEAGSE